MAFTVNNSDFGNKIKENNTGIIEMDNEQISDPIMSKFFPHTLGKHYLFVRLTDSKHTLSPSLSLSSLSLSLSLSLHHLIIQNHRYKKSNSNGYYAASTMVMDASATGAAAASASSSGTSTGGASAKFTAASWMERELAAAASPDSAGASAGASAAGASTAGASTSAMILFLDKPDGGLKIIPEMASDDGDGQIR